MQSSRSGILVSAVALLCANGWALASGATGEWSGTVASASGDDLSLAGVPVHFRIAGSVTEALTGRMLTAADLTPDGSGGGRGSGDGGDDGGSGSAGSGSGRD
jgi:hypothetical protein